MYKGNSIVTDIHFIHFELSFQTKAHHLNVYLCYVRKVQPKVIYYTTDLCHPYIIPGLGTKRPMWPTYSDKC